MTVKSFQQLKSRSVFLDDLVQQKPIVNKHFYTMIYLIEHNFQGQQVGLREYLRNYSFTAVVKQPIRSIGVSNEELLYLFLYLTFFLPQVLSVVPVPSQI